jgi:peptidoglycan/xylan/chitin deacetylase (PgdA/CDA1 family)
MLQQYNARVTFFVSEFGSLSEEEITMLRTLQADGNEIGFHGTYHTDAGSYLQTHTVQQYLNYEIIPGIAMMREAGLNPDDFAYPYGSDTPAATEALQAYFGHIRVTDDFWDDKIYYTYGSNQARISGIGIDESYGQSIETIYTGITRAQTEDKILSLYGHRPVQTVTDPCQTSLDRLEKILKYTSDNNLKFYTVRELT